jgi:hypothetical protein
MTKNEFINQSSMYSIDDVKNHYYRKTKGHWFDESTMSFFKSRLAEKLMYIPTENKVLFFSSEKGPDMKRLYSIREYSLDTGAIETIGLGFRGYKTLAAAQLAASKLKGVVK